MSPVGSKVHEIYTALRREGLAKMNAARIAQRKTKTSLKTGKPPKRKK